MNIKLSTTIIILAISMGSSAFSETKVSAKSADDSSPFYTGAKMGMLSIGHGIPFKDDGVMMGVLFGYDIPNNGFSFEGEFNTTISKASSKNPDYSDLGVTTLTGYGVYRTSGKFYLKGKVGLLYEYLTSSVSGGGLQIDVDGAGLAISFGIGGGIRFTDRLSAEIEYTSIEADIGYASFGVNWDF